MNIVATDWSRLTTLQQLKHLELEGYVVLPDLLAAAQCARIKEELYRLPTKGTDYSENQRGYSDVQFTDSPNAVEVIALPALIAFLERLFGDEVVCTSAVY